MRLADIDFQLVRLDPRRLLLRPVVSPDDELTLPLLGQQIAQDPPPGLVDVIATTVELCLVMNADVNSVLAALADRTRAAKPAGGHEIRLPVCFELTDPDWNAVEQQTGLTRRRYLARLERTVLRVAMYGFLPGFVYLSGLPRELRCGRKGEPRQRVEAGSVAVGGPWTGIYGLASPAGWHILGRTPVALVDPVRTPPLSLCIGDRLRLWPISAGRFAELADAPPTVEQLFRTTTDD